MNAIAAAYDAHLSDELATDFGWTVSIFAEAFAKWARDAVRGLPGGPRGYLVLDVVARGRPPSQLALARRLGIDRTVMTYLLDDLETAKLVSRRPDPKDRRARHVVLTAKGRRTLEAAREQIRATEDRLLSVLDPAEAMEFRRVLERVALAAHEEVPGVGAMGSEPPRD